MLAPGQTGLTTKEQPALYWYVAKAPATKVEVALYIEKRPEPVLEIQLDRLPQGGVQKLDLAKHGVRLSPNIEYQWVVALVPDPENRSQDSIASGVVERLAPSPALMDKVAHTDPANLPLVYAEKGIWFDALDALFKNLETNPQDSTSRSQIAALLSQVGLNDVILAGTPAP